MRGSAGEEKLVSNLSKERLCFICLQSLFPGVSKSLCDGPGLHVERGRSFAFCLSARTRDILYKPIIETWHELRKLFDPSTILS